MSLPSTSDTLAQATRLHVAGQLADAERLYRYILQVDGENAVVLHQLGVLCVQLGRLEEALQLTTAAIRSDRTRADSYANLAEIHRRMGDLEQAVRQATHALKLNPDQGAAHAILGESYRRIGKLPEAVSAYRAAARLDPENARVRFLLGEALVCLKQWPDAEAALRKAAQLTPGELGPHFYLATALQHQNKFDEAIASYQALLRIDPNNADALTNLGVIYKLLGNMPAAEQHLRQAQNVASDRALVHNNLGSVLAEQGRHDEALECCRRAYELDPSLQSAYYNAGFSLQHLGRFEDSIEAFRRACDLDPRSAPSFARLGSSLKQVGRKREALDALRRAAELDPSQPGVWSMLGVLEGEDGQYAQSMVSFREAARLEPNDAFNHYNQGCSLFQLDQFDEAIVCFQRAAELKPDHSEAYVQLGNCMKTLGRMGEALAYYRRGVELAPHRAGPHSNLIYAMLFESDHDEQRLFAEHLAWGRAHADPLTERAQPCVRDRDPNRRLRIGYVSGHFCAHAVSFFSEPIIHSHDRTNFEVFCYSDVPKEDAVTARFKAAAGHWRPIADLSDEEVAQQIERDQIDVLVDLAGHIAGGRLLAFAQKPAPVQVTYIGYQHTTGMRAMDYRLTDEWSNPPETGQYYTETLVRLPQTFFCYLSSRDAPLAEAPPAVSNGYVTFGSFNNFAKVTPRVLEVWGGILRSVPNSRLLILASLTDSLRRYILEALAAQGIGSDRVMLVHKCLRPEYMSWIGRVDVALDPFPFNGHTTTCDTLWMGVPVVALAGDSYVTRYGSSALVTLDRREWIARTTEEYQQIAVRLANDLDRLSQERRQLRGLMQASAICDAQGFTRNLESAYRQMWRDWCDKRSTS